MASLTPARVIGVDKHKGSLEPGKDADIAIFEPDFTAWRTLIGGQWVGQAHEICHQLIIKGRPNMDITPPTKTLKVDQLPIAIYPSNAALGQAAAHAARRIIRPRLPNAAWPTSFSPQATHNSPFCMPCVIWLALTGPE